ncbi:pH-sensitive chloride channel 2 [Drosophila sulfurigaster albostrigata]|uniref:pH-sensitive chloride channel 2 n=1 Tax=Drosophila sulfurigaster albostrigata TaxID=89887 RepID=UPI002D21DE48|nr:pH-sensitive chloride channel 2 [Drosophila sulfurigaster albostrigata]
MAKLRILLGLISISLVSAASLNLTVDQETELDYSTTEPVSTTDSPAEQLDSNCPTLVNSNALTQTELIARLTDICRYDRTEPPISVNKAGDIEPVEVFARFYISALKDLDATDLQFLMQGLLQLRYSDSRLAFASYAPNRVQPLVGEFALREKLWVPHIFFSNEVSSNILGTNEKDMLTTIYPDGTVLISFRVQATLYCFMNYRKFPFDEQNCTTILESWMYNTSMLELHWEPNNSVTFHSQLQLTEFDIDGYVANESISISDEFSMSHGALIGNYSGLSFSVLLTREVGYYIIEYFVPSIMIVAISWVSFWLQADQTPARTTLGCTTLLSFITLSLTQENNLSKVSYVTMSEVWFLVCTFFIFGSLMEFAFVNQIWRRNNNLELKKPTTKYIVQNTFVPKPMRRNPRSFNRSQSTQSTFNNPKNTVITIETPIIIGADLLNRQDSAISLEDNDSSLSSSSTAQLTPEKPPPQTFATMTPKEVSLWIDRKMRFIFPLAFIVFNALFWSLVYCL